MSKLCSPALLYLLMASVSIIFAIINRMKLLSILAKIVFVAIWTWFLNFLCLKGYTDVAWFLVILPFVIMLGVFVIAFEVLMKNNNNNKR